MSKYYQQTLHGPWTETEARPTGGIKKKLEREMDIAARGAHKHVPGMGWHNIPSEPMYVRTPQGGWWAALDTSEQCILAHAEDICILKGLSLVDLYMQAYPEPDDHPFRVKKHWRDGCLRPATLSDIKDVLDDLEDINFHSLREILEEKWNG